MVNLAFGLLKRGYLVEVFCYSPGDLLAQPLRDRKIPIHWYKKRSRFSFDVIFKLRDLIHSGKFDLGLSFLTTPNFYLIISSLLSGHHFPIVISERFCDLPSGVPAAERFARRFYRFADHVIVNSHHQRENLAARYPYLAARLSTIYNGYDLDVFTAAMQEPDNHPIKMLTIASVSPYKNGLCLIEALHHLKERHNICPQLDWIGQRVMAGDRLIYLRSMEQKIREYGLEDQWNWLDQRSDIVDQFHHHDILIHPSFGEGLPNVVCEALSCARPIIVSNVLDHSKLVQDNVSGFLFNAQDPIDLAEKILKFYNLTIQERRQMGQAGRRFAEANLSLDRFSDDYGLLFNQLMNK
jgi:glycosyltransferase involved in cell wall biosynthesis